MANKKINELDSRSSLSLSDLMAVGDPSTGYLYKTTISDLKTLTGAGVVSFNGRFGSVVPAEGDYTLTQLSDVIITSATNGNILQYNGSNWVNVAAADLSGFVPYTGATSNVNLGTYDLSADILNANDIKALTSGGLDIYSNSGTHIALMGGGGGAGTTFYGGLIGTTGSFSSSGGSNTFSIEHSSGSGIALSITKGGNGEGIYVNKTSGSGNAATIVGTLEATTLVKTGGTSSQFLKADGSVDSSTYLTTSSAASTYVPYTGATANVNLATRTLAANILTATGIGVNIDGDGTGGGALNLKNYNSISSAGAGYTSIFAQASDRVVFNLVDALGIKYVAFTFGNLGWNSQRYYALPNADGTLALTSQLHDAVTIGTANGLSLSGQALSLALASTSATGALSSTDWNTFNGKQAAGNYVTTDTTQTISGAKTFSSTLTVNNTITSSSTSLIFQQTGDVYGTTQLQLTNRDGANGAFFKNLGLDVVDFGFITSTTAQGNVRFEKRAGNRLTNNTTGEFQFLIPASGGTGFAYFQSGYFTTSLASGNFLIGTTTDAGYKLDVVGTARVSGLITANGGLQMEGQSLAFNQSGVRSWNIQATGGNLRMQSGDNLGDFTFSTNVVTNGYIQITKASNPSLYINNTSVQWQTYVKSNSNIAISDAVRDVLTLGYNGSPSFFAGCNVGIGITPSAWRSSESALQIGNATSLYNVFGLSLMGNNFFTNSSNQSIYLTTAAASFYLQGTGTHQWNIAPSGTAGNVISFTEAMRISDAGNLLIGTTSGSHRLSVTVPSGADREIIIAGVSGATNGFRVQWNHATSTTRVSISSIPTSSAGLPSGTIYSSAGVLMIA
jgi:hypothetical protein